MTSRLNWSFPIADGNGHASEALKEEINRLSLLVPITGTGSPEGVIEARLFQVYLDKTGGAGAIEYRKMLSDIGGDITQGWQAV